MDSNSQFQPSKTYWKIAFWVLLLCWLCGAGLSMMRLKGGFLTNYLSDLTFPAWFYIYIRGLSKADGRLPRLLILKDWFSLSPNRSFLSILFVGVMTEIKTYFFPTGVITGTFDFLDIVAYSVSLVPCNYFDSKQLQKAIKVQV